ncbi:hypothetical protein [Streptomyces viridochromogenes]|uniref:hypothetical protein n=1 Tax=Streptomyces viridochromogenes TaxID=1938 RepID=UPI00069EEF63|nr:hypothetical protein [Streptomyces viridochromogenes]KOG22005.1 hypothetical protein ADK36_13795 [Streptomyces viridochromogenes]
MNGQGPDGQDNDVGTVTIGAREIYDQLVAMREEVRTSTQSLATMTDRLADHEDRIRAVERWKYSVPTALVTAVLSAATTIYTKLGG